MGCWPSPCVSGKVGGPSHQVKINYLGLDKPGCCICLFVNLLICLFVYGLRWSVVDFALLRMEPALPEALGLKGRQTRSFSKFFVCLFVYFTVFR